jgi:hypothetical protein
MTMISPGLSVGNQTCFRPKRQHALLRQNELGSLNEQQQPCGFEGQSDIPRRPVKTTFTYWLQVLPGAIARDLAHLVHRVLP